MTPACVKLTKTLTSMCVVALLPVYNSKGQGSPVSSPFQFNKNMFTPNVPTKTIISYNNGSLAP